MRQMQPGEHEVVHEELVGAGGDSGADLFVVLKSLDRNKARAHQHPTQGQTPGEVTQFGTTQSACRKNHEERAREQHQGVRRAKCSIECPLRLGEQLRLDTPLMQVHREQHCEHKHVAE